MTERHYAHLAPNYVADTIRANFPRLTETKSANVVRIAHQTGSRQSSLR
jgi:ribosome recycling factor